MIPLPLHSFHQRIGAQFGQLNDCEVVRSYLSVESEYLKISRNAGLLDFTFRGRIAVLGKDREKFLHGQLTNEVLGLKKGEGHYAAIVSAKGKLQSDLFLYKLDEELLLDFEPGFTAKLIERLEKYVIADDVHLVDVAPHYSLFSIQGPHALTLLKKTALFDSIPEKPLTWRSDSSSDGEIYLMNNPRLNTAGYDLFVPKAAEVDFAERFDREEWVGWDAFEIARVESAVPRFGADMDENNLPQEAEIQDRAVSFSKGCYIGQEVIARIRTYGQVAKALRLLRLPNQVQKLAGPGEKLFKEGKEVGYLTSSCLSPKYGAEIALGYVRKETNSPGSLLRLGSAEGPEVQVVGIPGQI